MVVKGSLAKVGAKVAASATSIGSASLKATAAIGSTLIQTSSAGTQVESAAAREVDKMIEKALAKNAGRGLVGTFGAAALTFIGVMIPLEAGSGSDLSPEKRALFFPAPPTILIQPKDSYKPRFIPNPKPYKVPFPVNPYNGHGNNRGNTNPYMVYEFTFKPKDGKTPVLKYGIADLIKNPGRPSKQMKDLRRLYGRTVKWRTLMITPDRASALEVEKGAVELHKQTWGAQNQEHKYCLK